MYKRIIGTSAIKQIRNFVPHKILLTICYSLTHGHFDYVRILLKGTFSEITKMALRAHIFILSFLAFTNKFTRLMNVSTETVIFGKIRTMYELIRTLGSTSRQPCHIIKSLFLEK